METEFETNLGAVESIPATHIEGHVAYWCKLESIRAELSGITRTYRTDEAFLDDFGMSKQYLRRLKVNLRNRLENEAQAE